MPDDYTDVIDLVWSVTAPAYWAGNKLVQIAFIFLRWLSRMNV